MKITLISNLYPPEIIGGAEKHTADDARKLCELGHEVSVLTTTSEGKINETIREQRDGVSVYRFRPLNMYTPYQHPEVSTWKKPIQHTVNLWNPQVYRWTLNVLDDLSPDVIHIHNYGGLSMSIFSAAGQFDAPVLHTLHDYGALHIRPSLFANGEILKPGRLMNFYQKYNDQLIDSNVDQILAPSRFIIDLHRSAGMFKNTPTDHLQLGVEEISESAETEAGDTTNELKLLFAGQHTQSKGIDVLVDAVKELEKTDVELNILGKGPEKEALVKRADGDDRIQFHGFVSEEELERQYTNADYTIVPSRWYDNSPMVIYESYLRDTPVIGAAIGGIPELISEGETGFLFEPENTSSLAKVLEMHHEESSQLIPQIQDLDLSLETHVSGLIEIYKDLVGQDSHSSPPLVKK